MKISKSELQKIITESMDEHAKSPKTLIETFSHLFSEADEPDSPPQPGEMGSADGAGPSMGSRDDLVTLAARRFGLVGFGELTDEDFEATKIELVEDGLASQEEVDSLNYDEVLSRRGELDDAGDFEDADGDGVPDALQDLATQVVVNGRKAKLGVNELVDVMLVALQDEMRDGFTLEEVLQAVSKWSARMQGDLKESNTVRDYMKRRYGSGRSREEDTSRLSEASYRLHRLAGVLKK